MHESGECDLENGVVWKRDALMAFGGKGQELFNRHFLSLNRGQLSRDAFFRGKANQGSLTGTLTV